MKSLTVKILTIVAIVLIALLVTSAITLSLVKTNFDQVITDNEITRVTVFTDGKDNTYDNTSEEYKQILSKFEDGNKESVLSSLFQGGYSSDAKIEQVNATKSISEIEKATNTTDEDGEEVDTFVVEFILKTRTELVINGESITDTNDDPYMYTSVYLEVENNTNLTKITMYLVDSEESIYSSTKQVSYVAHHSDLYEYLQTLVIA